MADVLVPVVQETGITRQTTSPRCYGWWHGMGSALQGWCAVASPPNARHPQYDPNDVAYISMVLRMSPTARPSISKGSPGWTTMTG